MDWRTHQTCQDAGVLPDSFMIQLSPLTAHVLLIAVDPRVSVDGFLGEVIVIDVTCWVTVGTGWQEDGGVVVCDAESRVLVLVLSDIQHLKHTLQDLTYLHVGMNE